jgi:hypothetical protein
MQYFFNQKQIVTPKENKSVTQDKHWYKVRIKELTDTNTM